MAAYPTTHPVRCFVFGQDNAEADPSYTDPVGDPNELQPDARITVWDDAAKSWVVGDPTLPGGPSSPGGLGLFLPQLADRMITNKALGLRVVSIAAVSVDVDRFDPSSTEDVGGGLNRWQDGVRRATAAGLDPEYMLSWAGEGDGVTVLSEAAIEGHYRAIVAAARAQWPRMRRFGCMVPHVRLDLPLPTLTQSRRGNMLRAILRVARDNAEFMKVLTLERFDVQDVFSFPHFGVTQYGEIAKDAEPLFRA